MTVSTNLKRKRTLIILQDRLRNGGTERNSLWLANALNDEQWQTHLLLFVHPRPCPAPTVPQWSALRFDAGQLMPDCYAPGLIRALQTIQPDVLLCMGRNANCHGARLKKRMPGVRLYTSYRTNRRLPRLYRKSIGLSDGCITNSNWAQQQLIQKYGLLPSEKIHVIPNPLTRESLLTLERDAASKMRARRQLGIPDDALVCINCANFVRGKNQAAMLVWLAAALKKRPNIILLLLGDGPTRKRCQALAKKLKVSTSVRFCGHTQTLDSYFQASDVFVSTSLREGSPNALVEAQAAGLPVVAYDTAGSCETFANNKTGLCVAANDLPALSVALEKLLANPAMRDSFSSTARLFAQTHFSPSQTRLLYRQVLSLKNE